MKMMIDDDVVVIRCPWSFFTELIPNSQFPISKYQPNRTLLISDFKTKSTSLSHNS